MTLDEVVRLCEVAEQTGLVRIKMGELELEFRPSETKRNVVHRVWDAYSSLCGQDFRRGADGSSFDDQVTCQRCLALMRDKTHLASEPTGAQASLPVPKPGVGDLCHCGHSKATEHNHLGCLVGCEDERCRGGGQEEAT